MKTSVSIGLALLIGMVATWVSMHRTTSEEAVQSYSAEPSRAVSAVVEDAAPREAASSGASETDQQDFFLAEEQPDTEGEGVSESCDEMWRLIESKKASVSFADDAWQNPDICASAVLMLSRARMEALPGLTGFEIGDYGEQHPARLLAQEPDDFTWARNMEARIYAEVSSLVDFPLNSVHAVCRSSVCGLVLEYRSIDHHGRTYNVYAQKLAGALGFAGYHGGHTVRPYGIGFTFIYLGDWETRRPQPGEAVRLLSASFDAAFEEAAGGSDAQ